MEKIMEILGELVIHMILVELILLAVSITWYSLPKLNKKIKRLKKEKNNVK